jgi:serine/threonine protein kinase
MKPGKAGDVLSISSATTADSGGTGTTGDIQSDGSGVPARWPVFSGYEILAQLGRGGMGIVYKARERQTGQLVALKMMQRPDVSSLARFKQEFRALQEVSHPNLVILFGAFTEEGQWFFTMELLEGTDFVSYVRGGDADQEILVTQSFPPGPADTLSHDQLSRLRLALPQLTEGLAALHAAGKVHRDIKPSNILVTKDGKVKILDFGLAADLNPAGMRENSGQHLVGTVAYMAPEQANGDPVSSAGDWYSVGVILYESLTGQRPFRGSITQILIAKTNSEPRPPHTIIRGVPDDLDQLCTDLLRRLPVTRPSDSEMLARLAPPHTHLHELLPQEPHAEKTLIGRRTMPGGPSGSLRHGLEGGSCTRSNPWTFRCGKNRAGTALPGRHTTRGAGSRAGRQMLRTRSRAVQSP